MTVLAWDGITLAADKLAEYGGARHIVTKIRRLKNGDLFGGSGSLTFILQMGAWLDGELEEFPAAQRDKDDWEPCLVITKACRVLMYERTPQAIHIENRLVAIGSGKDYAIAAVTLGKTAIEAVELAQVLCATCGGGTDSIVL